MNILSDFADNKREEGKMKDVMLMLGFGFGLVTGALLYKYSQGAQDLVSKGEKKVMQGAKCLEKKAEEGMDQLESKIQKGAKKAEKGIQEIESQMKKGVKKAEQKMQETKPKAKKQQQKNA